MFPQPPSQVFGSAAAPGPEGLDAAASALFQTPGVPVVEEVPDPYANLNPEELLKRFRETKKDAQEVRWVFERLWWRIMLYLLDRQWIFFDTKRNEWRDKRLKKWIPKPVTNKLREVQSSIRAMFAAVQLGVLSRPNGNDPKNVATANTVDGLQPLVHEEHDMDEVMRLSDFWTVNLGNCFLYPWWNPDGGEVKPIEHEECTGCGFVEDPAAAAVPGQFTCPQCGSVESKPKKVGDAPIGKGETDVVSPFEILLPSYATNFKEVDRLIRIRWRPKTYYEVNYPELVPHISFEKQTGERSLNMFKALSAQSTMGTSSSFSSAAAATTEGITEYEYWEKPNKTWPKGLFFRVIGEKAEILLEDENQSTPGPLPSVTIKEEPIWPWVHQSYEPFGGRLWALGAIDPLIQKQDQLNQLDSYGQLCMQRMGNPIWLEPKGTEVEKFTGEPGLVVKYSMLGVTGAKPERIPGESLPASYFQLRAQYLSDIEEMAGTYDILKGSKPTGVEAFSALQLLVERSQSRFTQAFMARGEAYRRWFKVALELERKYGPTQRTTSLLGPNGTWTFETFLQADLMGDVSVVVQDGTNVPKTALGKRAAMEQANNMRFIDPVDSDTRHAFLSEMGLMHLAPALDSAKSAALRQQDAFEQWAIQGGPATGVPPPLKIQPWDDAEIMLRELRKWANSDKMQAIINDPTTGPVINAILIEFYTQLSMMVAEAQMQQAAMQGGGQPGGGQPGKAPGGGQAMARSNANSNAVGTAHPGAAAA